MWKGQTCGQTPEQHDSGPLFFPWPWLVQLSLPSSPSHSFGAGKLVGRADLLRAGAGLRVDKSFLCG